MPPLAALLLVRVRCDAGEPARLGERSGESVDTSSSGNRAGERARG